MLVQKSSFQFARKAMISFSRSQPNASRQKPKPLPHDGQRTPIWQQAGMRGEYAKTDDSGFGLLYAFVSDFLPQVIPAFRRLGESY